MTAVPDEPICICDDRAWLAQCFINGSLVDEVIVDTSLPVAQALIEEVRDKHYAMVEKAIDDDKSWRIKCICPNCKKGMAFDSILGVEIYA